MAWRLLGQRQAHSSPVAGAVVAAAAAAVAAVVAEAAAMDEAAVGDAALVHGNSHPCLVAGLGA